MIVVYLQYYYILKFSNMNIDCIISEFFGTFWSFLLLCLFFILPLFKNNILSNYIFHLLLNFLISIFTIKDSYFFFLFFFIIPILFKLIHSFFEDQVFNCIQIFFRSNSIFILFFLLFIILLFFQLFQFFSLLLPLLKL